MWMERPAAVSHVGALTGRVARGLVRAVAGCSIEGRGIPLPRRGLLRRRLTKRPCSEKRHATPAVDASLARGQIPGVTRLGRRVLFRTHDLLDWLDQNSCAIAEGVGR